MSWELDVLNAGTWIALGAGGCRILAGDWRAGGACLAAAGIYHCVFRWRKQYLEARRRAG